MSTDGGEGLPHCRELENNGLACPEPSKGESFQLNFDFLIFLLQFSHYLHHKNVLAPFIGDILACPAPPFQHMCPFVLIFSLFNI
jgi:hypothetical protein